MLQVVKYLISDFIVKIEKYLTGIIVILAFLLLPSYKLFNLESNIYDVQLKSKYLLSNQSLNDSLKICLIKIDNESRRKDTSGLLLDMSPLSRQYLSEIIDSLRKAKPKLIAIDVALDLKSKFPKDDSLLLKSFVAANNNNTKIVVATRINNNESIISPKF